MSLEELLPITRRNFLKSSLLFAERFLPFPFIVSLAEANPYTGPKVMINGRIYSLNERRHIKDSSGKVLTDEEELMEAIKVMIVYDDIIKHKSEGIKFKLGNYELFLPSQPIFNKVAGIQGKMMEYSKHLPKVARATARVAKELLFGSSLSDAITKEVVLKTVREIENQELKESLQQLASSLFNESIEGNVRNSRIANRALKTLILTDEMAEEFRENATFFNTYFNPSLILFEQARKQETETAVLEELFSPIKKVLDSYDSLDKAVQEIREKLKERFDQSDAWWNFESAVLKNIVEQREMDEARSREITDLVKKQIYQTRITYPIELLYRAACDPKITELSKEELSWIFPISLLEELNISSLGPKERLKEFEKYFLKLKRKARPSCLPIYEFKDVQQIGKVASASYLNPTTGRNYQALVIQGRNYWYLLAENEASTPESIRDLNKDFREDVGPKLNSQLSKLNNTSSFLSHK